MNYQTIGESIRNTPEWKAWLEYQEEKMEFDAWESNDTGWMSDEHAVAFLKFVRNTSKKEVARIIGNEVQLKDEENRS